MDLLQLKNEFFKKLSALSNLKELDILELEYFGREKGRLTEILRHLKDLSEEEKKTIGKEANLLREEFNNLINEKRNVFKKDEQEKKLKKEWIDVTAPGEKISKGSLHPFTKTINEAVDIFEKMGFSVAHGPDIETEWFNFDALNIPSDHPARDMWDTFWLKEPKSNFKFQISNFKTNEKLLLRTHTSPVQIRYMMSHNPPIRIIAPGRTYRYEATDSSHSHTFYQLECLFVDKNASVANFKSVVQIFFQKFFNKEIKTRIRPGYFPFVEPGFEIDISCVVCGGKGCNVCKKTGWLEIGGAGMVHRNVFKSAGYNPESYKGFAFGFGIDRLAMIKYKIPDIRFFYYGDLRFLKQF